MAKRHLASNNKLSAVTLRVPRQDLPQLTQFYRQKFGFRQQTESASSLDPSVEVTSFTIPSDAYSSGTTASGHASVEIRFTPTAKSSYTVAKGSSTSHNDVYWKIGLAVHDVDDAASKLGLPAGHQFLDIGYMQHGRDGCGLMFELLQTTFEDNSEERERIWSFKTQGGYREHFSQSISDDANTKSILSTQPFVVGQVLARQLATGFAVRGIK